MNDTTRHTLCAINRRFYRERGQEFSNTRSSPWPGWIEVVARPPLVGPHDPSRSTPVRILDVGCGNGRFGRFLDDHLESPISYFGVDSSPELVRIAHHQLAHCTFQHCEIREFDILELDLPEVVGSHGFDLIAVFGVLHHLPGFASRLSLLQRLEGLLSDGGVLALSFWQFADGVECAGRAVPWPQLVQLGLDRVDPGELEPGDFLLRWGPDLPSQGRGSGLSVRYCHHASDAEIEKLIEALGSRSEAQFRADGRDGRSNRYELLRRIG